MSDELLKKYLFLDYLHKDKRDFLDLLSPLILMTMGKSVFSTTTGIGIETIKLQLEQKYKLKVPRNSIITVLRRLENQDYLKKEEIKYIPADSDKKRNLSKSTKIHDFAPNIISIVNNNAEEMDIESLRTILKEKDIEIDSEELNMIMERLVDCEYLRNTRNRFILNDKGKLEYLKLNNFNSDLEENTNKLIEKILLYFDAKSIHINNTNKEKEIANILISFIHKNIEPLTKFLEKDDSNVLFNYDLSRDKERALCEFVKEQLKVDDLSYKVMKDLILGSTVMALYSLDEVREDKFGEDDFRDICVFLDSNLIFYLLEYSYDDFTKPTRELIDLMKSRGFKLKIFDFTLVEILRVLDGCVNEFERLHIPGLKINSICYFLRSKFHTTTTILYERNHMMDVLDKEHIEIIQTGYDLYNVKFDEEIRNSLRKFKKDQPLESQNHDLLAIEKIREFRGKSATGFEEKPAIFLTADQGLFDFNFSYLKHKEHHTIPEVLVDRLLTNMLWLLDPSKTDLSLGSLTATCSRDTYIKRNEMYKLSERIEHLEKIKKLNHNDLVYLAYTDSLQDILKRYKSDEDLDENILTGIEKGKDKKFDLERSLVSSRNEIKVLTTQLKETQDDIKELKNKIKNNKEAQFNKLSSLKNRQKSKESEYQNKISHISRSILCILIIFLYVLPPIYIYHQATIDQDYVYLTIYLGIVPVMGVCLGIIKQFHTNLYGSILIKLNKLENSIYRIINRGRTGIVISYGRNDSANLDYKIKDEYIKLENTSKYIQNIGNFSLFINQSPFYIFLTDTSLKPDSIIKIHTSEGVNDSENIYTKMSTPIIRNNSILVEFRNRKNKIVDFIEADIFG